MAVAPFWSLRAHSSIANYVGMAQNKMAVPINVLAITSPWKIYVSIIEWFIELAPVIHVAMCSSRAVVIGKTENG